MVRGSAPFALGGAFISLPIILVLISPALDAVNDSGVWGAHFVQWIPIHIFVISLLTTVVVKLRNHTFQQAETQDSPNRSNVIALVVMILVILVMLWPVSRWDSNLFGGTGDSYNWRWQLWRFGQELKDWNVVPTRFDDAVVPYGVDLRLNDGYIGMYIGGFWNLIFGATLAYNLTIASAISLNYWFARRLSLMISNSNMIAIAAGIGSATAPCIAIRYPGHTNLAFSFVLFLVVGQAILLFSDRPPNRFKPALFLLLAFLSSFYFFILGSLIYFAAALIRLFRTSETQSRMRYVAKIASIAAMVSLSVSPFVLTRLQHDSNEKKAGAPSVSVRTDEYMYYSADPRTFYIPSFDSHLNAQYATTIRSQLSPNTVENTPFPGYLFLISIALGIALLRPWRWLIAAFWSVFSILALGPTLTYGPDSRIAGFFPRALVDDSQYKAVSWLLYSDLTRLPGFTALRTPNRFAFALPVIGTIALALLANKYKHLLLNRKRISGLLLIIGILLLPNWRSSNYWFDTGFTPSINAALQKIQSDKSDSRVVIAGDNCLLTIAKSNLQIKHGHPIIGCQTFSAAMPWYSSLTEYKSNSGLASIQCDSTHFGMVPTSFKQTVNPNQQTLTELKKDLKVGYVIIDKSHLCADNEPRADQINDVLSEHSDLLGNDSNYAIYKLR
jgi:hypothetical protein